MSLLLLLLLVVDVIVVVTVSVNSNGNDDDDIVVLVYLPLVTLRYKINIIFVDRRIELWVASGCRFIQHVPRLRAGFCLRI